LNACGGGERPIRGIGARTDAAVALRYKTPLWANSLKRLKIWPAVRYKTRCAVKALY
jgi:hypothetical protein